MQTGQPHLNASSQKLLMRMIRKAGCCPAYKLLLSTTGMSPFYPALLRKLLPLHVSCEQMSCSWPPSPSSIAPPRLLDSVACCTDRN